MTEAQAAKMVQLLDRINENVWALRELAEKVARRFGIPL